MGDLIRLRPRQGAKSAATPSAAAEHDGRTGATILLFLGVRYERHAEDSSSPPRPQSRGGSRRKRA